MEHYGNFKDELKKRTDHAEEVIRRWLPEEKGFARTMAESDCSQGIWGSHGDPGRGSSFKLWL